MDLTKLKFVFAFIGAFCAAFIGEFNGVFYALLFFCIADYITGIMRAVLEKKLSSSIGFKGIFKKILIFMLVGIAHVIDLHIIKSGDTVRTATIFFYAANEGISILENCSSIGLPVPQKIKDVLAQLKTDKG